MLTYTAVIVTFNRKKSLKKSINSILNQSIKPNNIVLIDNNSTDGTYEYIKEYLNNQKIHYLKLKENLGGAGGFYFGVKEAMKYEDDLIAVADDDAYYDMNYFKNIITAAIENPQDGAFCGKILDKRGIQADQAKFLSNPKRLRLKGAVEGDYKKDFYCDVFSFLGAVYRRSTIEKVGFPQKDFFIWFDDAEYSVRCYQAGIKYHCVTNAVINHDIKEASQTPLWKEFYGFRNEIYSIKELGNAKFYPIFMLLKKYGAVTLRKNYKGKRVKAFKIITQAFIDGKKGKLGKRYDPATTIYK